MKCIILCAGYATRLYPLTLEKPKALLPVKGKPLLSHIIEKIPPNISEIILVSNNKFYPNFLEWSKTQTSRIKVLNDLTLSNETRLGGIGDLWFAIEKENINEDLLVILGDNLFDFALSELLSYFYSVNETILGVCSLKGQDLRNYGIVEISKGKVKSFEEKPENPKSNLAAIGIYIYTKKDIQNIQEYMKTNYSKDGPGFLIKYLSEKKDVYAFVFNGKWFDIGSKEIYAKVNEEF